MLFKIKYKIEYILFATNTGDENFSLVQYKSFTLHTTTSNFKTCRSINVWKSLDFFIYTYVLEKLGTFLYRKESSLNKYILEYFNQFSTQITTVEP